MVGHSSLIGLWKGCPSLGRQSESGRQIAYTRTCRISPASSYSPRKASMGSVLDARLAGSAEAASDSSNIAMAESESTPGSKGLTSNRKERSKRDEIGRAHV